MKKKNSDRQMFQNEFEAAIKYLLELKERKMNEKAALTKQNDSLRQLRNNGISKELEKKKTEF